MPKDPFAESGAEPRFDPSARAAQDAEFEENSREKNEVKDPEPPLRLLANLSNSEL